MVMRGTIQLGSYNDGKMTRKRKMKKTRGEVYDTSNSEEEDERMRMRVSIMIYYIISKISDISCWSEYQIPKW